MMDIKESKFINSPMKHGEKKKRESELYFIEKESGINLAERKTGGSDFILGLN